MRLSRWALAVAGVVSLLVSVIPSVSAEKVDAAVPQAAAQSRTVTLITGDRITLSPDRRHYAVDPGPGRDDVYFSANRFDGQLYVIPSDVQSLVGRDRLDRALFDVTELLRYGYGDAQRDSVPVLAEYAGAAAPSVLRKSGGVQLTQDVSALNIAAVEVSKSGGWDQIRPGNGAVTKLWLDGKRRLLLDESVPQIGAPEAWNAGYTGKGATVAVLDGGVDTTHPDLADQVVASKNFTSAKPEDLDGHGTHVASTIAGTGAASDGKYIGVAPDADLVSGKVCEEYWCLFSDILAGMTWAAKDRDADVINMSLGGPDDPGIDPIERAVNDLTAQTDALFVIAAGNNYDPESIDSPGSAAAALTVGAVDKQDQIADFSSRGPAPGDRAVKPDVVAPGVDIVAAKSATSSIGEPVGDSYLRLSGTSMATPHVAGAAALLTQQHPDWTAAQLKSALMGSANELPKLTVYDQGAGRVNLSAAIAVTVLSEPASISFGTKMWPHNDDRPVTRTLTYRNVSDRPVTLALDAHFTGADGTPAPDDALSLSSDSLTVPANGTSSVRVTSDTNHDGADGYYGGSIIAVADGVEVRTPVGVEKEVESYELTVKGIGADGKQADFDAFVVGVGIDEAEGLYGTSQTLRLPAADYTMSAHISAQNTAHEFSAPNITLDRDRTITLDVRKTKPMSIDLDTDVARIRGMSISFIRGEGVLESSSGYLGGDPRDWVRTAQVGEPAPPGEYEASVSTEWARPGPKHNFVNSPDVYTTLDYRSGSFYTGIDQAVRVADLAKIDHVNGDQAGTGEGVAMYWGSSPMGTSAWSAEYRTRLPFTVRQYATPGPVSWSRELDQMDDDDFTYLTMLAQNHKVYPKPQRYRETWNTAVFSPSLSDAFVRRYAGGMFVFAVDDYSDGYGHAGSSALDSGVSRLYRNGELISTADYPGIDAEVPAGSADFRFENSSTRSHSTVSTKVSGVWRFHSVEPTGDYDQLPVWVVRFMPKVDGHSRMTRTDKLAIPVRVQANPGSAVGELRRVRVQASSDDGKTWRPARLERISEGRYVAHIRPAPDANYISLKAYALDSVGSSVKQTIIHAFAFKD